MILIALGLVTLVGLWVHSMVTHQSRALAYARTYVIPIGLIAVVLGDIAWGYYSENRAQESYVKRSEKLTSSIFSEDNVEGGRRRRRR